MSEHRHDKVAIGRNAVRKGVAPEAVVRWRWSALAFSLKNLGLENTFVE
jgi:hypothetical protein